jgi:hypothetical protein
VRRTLLVLVVATLCGLSGIVALPSSAGAGVLTADDFAADCNDDGIISLTEDTKYVGGSADIIGVELFPGLHGCMVDLDERGVDLVLVRVRLRGKGGAFLNIGQASTGRTSIRIRDSRINMHPESEPGGFLSIKSGCCGGFASERNTDVNIDDSTLRATAAELGASIAAPRGDFALRDSLVKATGDDLPGAPDIHLRVSEGGAIAVDGRLSARRNVFSAPGGFEAATGISGDTSVLNNDFTSVGGGITVTTGAGGTCESLRNTPAVPCT